MSQISLQILLYCFLSSGHSITCKLFWSSLVAITTHFKPFVSVHCLGTNLVLFFSPLKFLYLPILKSRPPTNSSKILLLLLHFNLLSFSLPAVLGFSRFVRTWFPLSLTAVTIVLILTFPVVTAVLVCPLMNHSQYRKCFGSFQMSMPVTLQAYVKQICNCCYVYLFLFFSSSGKYRRPGIHKRFWGTSYITKGYTGMGVETLKVDCGRSSN